MAFLTSLFLIMHLLVGLAWPYRREARPVLPVLAWKAGRFLNERLNREARAPSARFARGVASALVVMGACWGAGFLLGLPQSGILGAVARLLALSLCVDFMAPLKAVMRVSRALEANDLPDAAGALESALHDSIGRPDEHAIIRRTAEYIAESLTRYLLGPVFWFLLTGPAGMFLYAASGGLYHAFGMERQRAFGRFIIFADAALNIIPALLTGVLLSFSAIFVAGSNAADALETMRRKGLGYTPLCFGWPVAAMAGGLGITLGGPAHIGDITIERPWIELDGSTARVTPQDLARASILHYVFFISFLGLISLLTVFKYYN